MRVVSLWSGGKDSCFACYKAMQYGHQVVSLFNFIDKNRKTSLSHGLSPEIIAKQAKSIGIPLLTKPMPKETYREDFKKLILEWKEKENIQGIVFGDIYLEEHRDWIDKVCGESNLEAIFPIWMIDTKELVEKIIDSGFKAIVVSARADIEASEKWLGSIIDKDFIQGLASGIDPCAENGEFHTFVFDGPLFNQPVAFSLGKKILKEKCWFLELIA
ncbi:MAG: hypothetical protein A3G37_00720 [Omnitrophica WOR_2 bacterium RIFCSPLOWO2_12_FULL_46_30]|nr:MAG: hypothetical protein A3G37_00720 [Omnitrophica WOR_2 bacterium RIFCSPLOWO2_12_FULL_46_30]